MDELLGRTLGTAVVALVLFLQSRRVPAGSRRRQAFELAAAAFGIFAMGNGLVLRGYGDEMAVLAGTFIGLILLGFSVFMLVVAYRAGEMKAQLRQAGDLITEERRKVAERAAALERRKAEEEQP